MENRQVGERKDRKKERERGKGMLLQRVESVNQQHPLPMDPSVFDVRPGSFWAAPASD